MKESIRILQLEGAVHESRDLGKVLRAAGFEPQITRQDVADIPLQPGQMARFDAVIADLDAGDPDALLAVVAAEVGRVPLVLIIQQPDPSVILEGQRLGAVVLAKKDTRSIAHALQILRESDDPLPNPVLTALNALTDPVVGLDPAGRICFANRAFRLRSLQPLGALLGMRAAELPPTSAFMVAVGAALADGPGPRRALFEGELCCLSVQQIPLEDGSGRALLLRDVTAEHRNEETVRQLENQLLHSQKMQSVAVLASGIAHDFNNILTGIFGSAELARMSLTTDHPAYADLETIVQASRRAAELTKELLAYAHQGSRGLEIADLNQIVTSLLVILRSQVSRSIIVRKGLAPDVPAVSVYVPKIQQVLMNLCVNASEAMADTGGILSIVTDRVHIESGDQEECAVGHLMPGEYAVVEVMDTGRGIEESVRRQLFDPFFSTKQGHRGLGLAAAMRILLEHRGAMAVESPPGEGAVFRIFLPAVAAEASEEAVVVGETETLLKKQTILFVDDEEMLRALCQRGLERMGYRVLLAADGIEAVRLHKEHVSEIDLVVLDLSMPRKGGEDAYREMRMLRPDVRILLSCGYDEQSAGDSFSPENLVGFLAKPFGMDELGSAIRRALARKMAETSL